MKIKTIPKYKDPLILDCSDDKRTEIMFRLHILSRAGRFFSNSGSILESIITSSVSIVTLAIILIPGLNYHTTKWYQSIEILNSPSEWAFSGLGISQSKESENTPLEKVFPIPGYDFESKAITSDYGPRTHPVTGKSSFHSGTDFAVPVGTPILSTESGIVAKIWDASNGNACGNGVFIQFSEKGDGIKYCHMDKVNVQLKQDITAGQVVGLSGNTGSSTGPHLHVERYIDRESGAINPNEYLKSLIKKERNGN